MEPDLKVFMIIFVCGEAQTMEQSSLLLMMMMISALFRLSKKGCVLGKTFKNQSCRYWSATSNATSALECTWSWK